MKIFRKIELALRKVSEYGLNPLQIEIRRTQRALSRYKAELLEIGLDDEDEDNYIMAYYQLSNKIKRVSLRLEQLRVKRQKNNSLQ